MSGGKACPKCSQFFTWSEYFGHEPMCGKFDKYFKTDEQKLEQEREQKEKRILDEVRTALSSPQIKNESTPTKSTNTYPSNDHHQFIKPDEPELTGLEKARSQMLQKPVQLSEEQEV
jgi:hypothetical protein